jgi:hypothetical protein
LPVRAHDFQDVDAIPGQDTGELGTVAAGALNANSNDLPEAGDELDDFAVAGSNGQEFLIADVHTGFSDDRDVMGIGVSVDPGDDFQMLLCHDETGPGLPLRGVGHKGHAGRVADKTVMGFR